MSILGSVRASLNAVTTIIEDGSNTVTRSFKWSSDFMQEHHQRWKHGQDVRNQEYAAELDTRVEQLILQRKKEKAKYESLVSSQEEQTILNELNSRISSWK